MVKDISKMIQTLALAFTIFGSAYSQYEGMTLGGYGATNFIELVESDNLCGDKDIQPNPPGVIPAANPTWVAEYVDNAIYLCGGQVNFKDSFRR